MFLSVVAAYKERNRAFDSRQEAEDNLSPQIRFQDGLKKRSKEMNTVIVSCASCGKKNRIAADKQHRSPKCGHCGTSINLLNKAVPVELSDQNFHDVVKQAPLPMMVDFYSPTCGPCRVMMPIVDAMAKKHVNKFIIAKVDTSRNQQIASFFNIRGVPSFFFFKNGELVDRMAGAVSEGALDQKLSSLT